MVSISCNHISDLIPILETRLVRVSFFELKTFTFGNIDPDFYTKNRKIKNKIPKTEKYIHETT